MQTLSKVNFLLFQILSRIAKLFKFYILLYQERTLSVLSRYYSELYYLKWGTWVSKLEVSSGIVELEALLVSSGIVWVWSWDPWSGRTDALTPCQRGCCSAVAQTFIMSIILLRWQWWTTFLSQHQSTESVVVEILLLNQYWSVWVNVEVCSICYIAYWSV